MLRGSRADENLTAELESHIAMHTEDGVRSGLHPEEARRQALIQLGGAEQIREAHRIRRTLPWLEILVHDAGYSLRQLRNSPGFALTSVLTLVLAIGANSAVFSLVHAIPLRRLPFNAPSRVFSVAGFSAVGLDYDPKSHNSEAAFAAPARSFVEAILIALAGGFILFTVSTRNAKNVVMNATAMILTVMKQSILGPKSAVVPASAGTDPEDSTFTRTSAGSTNDEFSRQNDSTRALGALISYPLEQRRRRSIS
jgi:hypothetical protein